MTGGGEGAKQERQQTKCNVGALVILGHLHFQKTRRFVKSVVPQDDGCPKITFLLYTQFSFSALCCVWIELRSNGGKVILRRRPPCHAVCTNQRSQVHVDGLNIRLIHAARQELTTVCPLILTRRLIIQSHTRALVQLREGIHNELTGTLQKIRLRIEHHFTIQL